jgi:hypothetical protein
MHGQYEAFAWWLTREQIGQGLREHYALHELPSWLLTPARKLDTAEGNQLPQETSPNWLRRLDAVEGNQLLRGCKKRLGALTCDDYLPS